MAIIPYAKSTAADSLSVLLAKEINGFIQANNREKVPPYFISLRVDNEKRMSFAWRKGHTVGRQEETRSLTPYMRVGSKTKDNFYGVKVTNDRRYTVNVPDRLMIPFPLVSSDYLHAMITDRLNTIYKGELRWFNRRFNNASSHFKENSSYSFSSLAPVVYQENAQQSLNAESDCKKWKGIISRTAGSCNMDDSVSVKTADFKIYTDYSNIVNSEGSDIAVNKRLYSLDMNLSVISPNDRYSHNLTYTSPDESGLPDGDKLMEDMRKLCKFRHIASPEDYDGPVLLSEKAAGKILHYILGHRLEGNDVVPLSDGRGVTDSCFSKSINDKVLPEYISIYNDPTMTSYNGKSIAGSYIYDDEGVKSERVKCVDKGIVCGYLLSRNPYLNFNASNGCGRAVTGYRPLARQSNLVVESGKSYTDEKLRDKFIREIKKQGSDFGYYIEDVNLGNEEDLKQVSILLNEAYRIYSDGRTEELVTSLRLTGTPDSILMSIMGVSDTREASNFLCNWIFGQFPVSTVSPKVLLSKAHLTYPEEYWPVRGGVSEKSSSETKK